MTTGNRPIGIGNRPRLKKQLFLVIILKTRF